MFKGLSPLLTPPKHVYGGGIRGRGGVCTPYRGVWGVYSYINERGCYGVLPCE